MKIAAGRIEGFLKAPDDGIRAVLIYGNDGGLVRERAAGLLKAVVDDPDDPFAVCDIDQNSLKAEPSRLADELSALSFTGGPRAVRVRDAGNWVTKPLELALAASGDNLIILEAGELGPRDALRKLCESEDTAAAVACYGDDAHALEALAVSLLRERGYSIEPTALNALVSSLGADRGLSRREIEKLALYKGDEGGEIGIDDVEACIIDATALLRDDVALAALSGDQARLDRTLVTCRAAGEAPIAILRTVMRHLQRLHFLSEGASRGGDLASMVQRLRPPVFFKHRAVVQGQARQWSPPRLLRAMTLVTEAEIACKTTGTPEQAVMGQALIRIANAARIGRGR